MIQANRQETLPMTLTRALVTFRQASLRDVHAVASVVFRSFQLAQTSHFTLLVQDPTPEEQKLRETGLYQRSVKSVKHQLATARALTRVALLDGEVVGCAECIIKLGTERPRQLQTYVRKLTFREKLLHIYLAVRRKIQNSLPGWPKWLEEWLWPVSEQQRKLSEFLEAVMQRRREACRNCIPGSRTEKDHLILNSLSVLPEYQRKGIGKALVQHGLDMAKDAGVPIFLVAPPAGKRLYDRMGFTTLHEYEVGDPEGMETVMKYEAL